MLRLQYRLPLNSPSLLVAGGMSMIMKRQEKRQKSLTMETLNPLIKEVEYAVRGKSAFHKIHFFFPS